MQCSDAAADGHAAVRRNAVAITAAEQVVDWLVEQAALEIPERDVDAGDGVGQGAARAGERIDSG
jgi:hypothetical protein